jgi:hypothetical protein
VEDSKRKLADAIVDRNDEIAESTEELRRTVRDADEDLQEDVLHRVVEVEDERRPRRGGARPAGGT